MRRSRRLYRRRRRSSRRPSCNGGSFCSLSLPGLAGAEGGSCVSQIDCNAPRERVRAPEHAPRDPVRVLERRRGLAQIVECGAGVMRAFDLAAVEAAKPFDGVAALPIGEATARGVSEGVLAHDAHNSYHYADAGRLYELEMLLNAFAIASRRQP